MLENCLQPDERFQDNPLGFHLQTIATSFVEDGYADETVRSKLGLLSELGQWFGRTRLAVTNLDERLVEAFVNLKDSRPFRAVTVPPQERRTDILVRPYTPSCH